MTMKKIIITAYLLVATLISMGQQEGTANKNTTAKRLSFHSINAIGLHEGETGTSFQLQTVNGVQLHQWFAGIGAGLDYYTYRTVPLFLDVRRNLWNKRITPFVYADGGMNFPWIPKDVENSWYNSNFKGGLYYDIGIGYAIQTKNSGGFLLSL